MTTVDNKHDCAKGKALVVGLKRENIYGKVAVRHVRMWPVASLVYSLLL